jgi:hypothetical protein
MVVLALATRLAKRLSPSGFPRFETILVTQTPAGDARDSLLPFCVIRQQGTSQLPRLIREADVVPVAGAAIAPILWSLSAKPVVIEHHGFQTICLTGQLFQEPQNVPCPGHFMAGNHGTCLRCCPATSSRLSCFRLWLFTFVRRLLCKLVSVNIVPTAWLANVLCLPRTETVPRVLPPAPPLVGIAGSQDVPSIAFVGRLVTTKGVRLCWKLPASLRNEIALSRGRSWVRDLSAVRWKILDTRALSKCSLPRFHGRRDDRRACSNL